MLAQQPFNTFGRVSIVVSVALQFALLLVYSCTGQIIPDCSAIVREPSANRHVSLMPIEEVGVVKASRYFAIHDSELVLFVSPCRKQVVCKDVVPLDCVKFCALPEAIFAVVANMTSSTNKCTGVVHFPTRTSITASDDALTFHFENSTTDLTPFDFLLSLSCPANLERSAMLDHQLHVLHHDVMSLASPIYESNMSYSPTAASGGGPLLSVFGNTSLWCPQTASLTVTDGTITGTKTGRHVLESHSATVSLTAERPTASNTRHPKTKSRDSLSLTLTTTLSASQTLSVTRNHRKTRSRSTPQSETATSTATQTTMTTTGTSSGTEAFPSSSRTHSGRLTTSVHFTLSTLTLEKTNSKSMTSADSATNSKLKTTSRHSPTHSSLRSMSVSHSSERTPTSSETRFRTVTSSASDTSSDTDTAHRTNSVTVSETKQQHTSSWTVTPSSYLTATTTSTLTVSKATPSLTSTIPLTPALNLLGNLTAVGAVVFLEKSFPLPILARVNLLPATSTTIFSLSPSIVQVFSASSFAVSDQHPLTRVAGKIFFAASVLLPARPSVPDQQTVVVIVLSQINSAQHPFSAELFPISVNTSTGDVGLGAPSAIAGTVDIPAEYGGFALYQVPTSSVIPYSDPTVGAGIVVVAPDSLVMFVLDDDMNASVVTNPPALRQEQVVMMSASDVNDEEPLPFVTLSAMIGIYQSAEAPTVLSSTFVLNTRGGTDLCATQIIVSVDAPSERNRYVFGSTSCVEGIGSAATSAFIDSFVVENTTSSAQSNPFMNRLFFPRDAQHVLMAVMISSTCTLQGVLLDTSSGTLSLSGRVSLDGCSAETKPVFMNTTHVLLSWSSVVSIVDVQGGRISRSVNIFGSSGASSTSAVVELPGFDTVLMVATGNVLHLLRGADLAIFFWNNISYNVSSIKVAERLEITTAADPSTAPPTSTGDAHTTMKPTTSQPRTNSPASAPDQSQGRRTVFLNLVDANNAVLVAIAMANGSDSAIVAFRQVLYLPSEGDQVLSANIVPNRICNVTMPLSEQIVNNTVPSFEQVMNSSNGGEMTVVSGVMLELTTRTMSFVLCLDEVHGWTNGLASSALTASDNQPAIFKADTSLAVACAGDTITFLPIGPAFNQAIVSNGTEWRHSFASATSQRTSNINPRKTIEGAFAPTATAGAALDSEDRQFLFIEDLLNESRVVFLSINEGGRVSWSYSLGLHCNESTAFMNLASDTATSFACVHHHETDSSNNHRAFITTFVVDVPGQTVSMYATVTVVVPNSSASLPSNASLMLMSMVSCTEAPTLQCRMLLAVVAHDLFVFDVTPNQYASFWSIDNTSAAVNEGQGVQLSEDGAIAYFLSSQILQAVSLFAVPNPQVLWTSSAASAGWSSFCAVQPSGFTPCHIEVCDSLCRSGGGCYVVMVSVSNSSGGGVQTTRGNLVGFSTTNVNQKGNVSPAWKLISDAEPAASPDSRFFAEVLCPIITWNAKLFIFSAFNTSVSCYDVVPNGSPNLLWSTAINNSYSTSISGIRGWTQDKSHIFGLLFPSDFGIITAVLRLDYPCEVANLAELSSCTYSVAVGLDAFSGKLIWAVEPNTYGTGADLDIGTEYFTQDRSFVADGSSAYAMWNGTVFVTQLVSTNVTLNPQSTESLVSVERLLVGLSVLNGSVQFVLPVPSFVAAASSSPSSSRRIDVQPLLLTVVERSSILIVTEIRTKNIWSLDISLFPRQVVLMSTVQTFERSLAAIDAFYLMGTLAVLPDSWRPATSINAWSCVEINAKNATTGALTVSFNVSRSCNLSGIVNWSAIPTPSSPVWHRRSVVNVDGWIERIDMLDLSGSWVPGVSCFEGVSTAERLFGLFDLHILANSNISYFDVSCNALRGAIGSFNDLPSNLVVLNLSNNPYLQAGTDLFSTDAEKSLDGLRQAESLAVLDLSFTDLSTSVANSDFLLYAPNSLQTLRLDHCNLHGALFELSGNTSSSSSMQSLRRGGSAAVDFAPSLTFLSITENMFIASAKFPLLFCDDLPPNLLFLNLSANVLTSSTSLYQTSSGACSLQTLDLSNNGLEGALNFELLSPHLLTLLLNGNTFSGPTLDLSMLRYPQYLLQTLDIQQNALIFEIVLQRCPQIDAFTVINYGKNITCVPNSTVIDTHQEFINVPMCADLRESSVIYPATLVSGNVSVAFLRNTSSDPIYKVNKAGFAPCYFPITNFARDNQTGMFLNVQEFVRATALCLPRNMHVLTGFIDVDRFENPDKTISIVATKIAIQYKRNESDADNVTLAKMDVANRLPGEPMWCNFTTESCNFIPLGMEFCYYISKLSPYNMTITDTGINAENAGQNGASVQYCNFSAGKLLLAPDVVNVSNVFPSAEVIGNLSNCLPTGGLNPLSYEGAGMIADISSDLIYFVQPNGGSPVQFNGDICSTIQDIGSCPYLPNMSSIVEPEESCFDGYCAEAKSIIWGPCGTSVWNYEGFHAVKSCHPLSTILKAPLSAETFNPTVNCRFDEENPTCAQLAGWVAQVDFFALLSDQQPTAIPPNVFSSCLPTDMTSTIVKGITDFDVLWALRTSFIQPRNSTFVKGYCTNKGRSLIMTSCGAGGIEVPIVQLEANMCYNGLTIQCTTCLPYIEPRATALPYGFIIISSVKDILFILVGAYFLSKPWFRRPITSCLTRFLLSITPLNVREKEHYRKVIMARFNPLPIAPGTLLDICDELLIRDDQERMEYREKRESLGSETTSRTSFHGVEDETLNDFLRNIGLRNSTTRISGSSSRRNIGGSNRNLVAPPPSLAPSDQPPPSGVRASTRIFEDLSDRQGKLERERSRSVRSRRSTFRAQNEFQRDAADAEKSAAGEDSATTSSAVIIDADDEADEVRCQFYRYYREHICEHNRRRILNTDDPIVRQRFQHVFDLYEAMFTYRPQGRERLTSNMFLDLDPEETNLQQTDRSGGHAESMSQRFFDALSVNRSGNPSRARFTAAQELEEPMMMQEMDTTLVYKEKGDDAEEVELQQRGKKPLSVIELQKLERAEEELAEAKQELLEACEMLPVILVATVVDARFTPQAWMLCLEGGYAMLYFIVCIWQSTSTPGYSSWDRYQSVYFRYINSCVSVGLAVNSLLRRIYLDQDTFAMDPFVVTSLVMVGPAWFTHVIPGIILYFWIPAAILSFWIPCCIVMRFLERRYFHTMDPLSIAFRVVFRLGTTSVMTLLLQSSFNWAVLFYSRREDLGYLGIVSYEYSSRTWACLIESRLESLANMVQLLSVAA